MYILATVLCISQKYSLKINLLDNSSIIYKVQSNTMSFNNQKNNTITIFRLENWTHLIFWFLFLKSPLFNKLLCSAQQQEERVKTHSSSNLWIIVYTFLVKDYVYSFNYRNKFHKRYTKVFLNPFKVKMVPVRSASLLVTQKYYITNKCILYSRGKIVFFYLVITSCDPILLPHISLLKISLQSEFNNH